MSVKQAFARVPRFPKGNQSSKPASKQEGTRIDARWLANLQQARLNQDLSTVMTKVSADLSVTINPQGSVGYALKTSEGKVVADGGDIIRIQTLNASITNERKEAQKSEVSDAIRYVLAAFVRRGQEVGRPISKIPLNFIEVYRSINSLMSTLSRNVTSIESVEVPTGTPAFLIKNMMLEFGKRIRVAAGDYFYHRLTIAESETPRKINSFLRESFVPICLYNKLTQAGLTTNQQGFDIRQLLFPSDASKGFYLTFREIRDEEFIQNLGGLLGGADLVIQIANNDGLLRRLMNLSDEVDLDDFDTDKSFASKVASVPFWVPPFEGAVDYASIFNFLAKNGVRGINWNSGTVLSPQDNLKFVGTLAKRTYYGLVSRPSYKMVLLAEMFPGFVFNPLDEEQRDIYVQLKSWSLTTTAEITWFKTSSSVALYKDGVGKSVLLHVLQDVLSLDPAHAIIAGFSAMLEARQTGLPVGVGDNLNAVDHFTEVKNLATNLRAQNEDALKIIGSRFSGNLGKQKTQKKKGLISQNRIGLSERSMLTPRSQSVIAIMRQRQYTGLSERMTQWFRQFLTTDVQDAVADLFLARLDAFLATPIQLNREDRLAFMEPDEYGVEESGTGEEPEAAEPPGNSESTRNPDDE
jgi:hypothetical protein